MSSVPQMMNAIFYIRTFSQVLHEYECFSVKENNKMGVMFVAFYAAEVWKHWCVWMSHNDREATAAPSW